MVAMCLVTLYNEADEPVGEPFRLPSLPFPGLRVLYEGEAWEVLAVSVTPTHPRSPSAREGDHTPLVDARVRLSEGIHD